MFLLIFGCITSNSTDYVLFVIQILLKSPVFKTKKGCFREKGRVGES